MGFFKELKVEDLSTLEDCLLVDIRDMSSYEEGHIVGAISVHNFSNFKDLLEESRGKDIVVYCYVGLSSQAFANRLVEFGFRSVYNLSGGYEAFKRKEYGV